MKILNRLAIAVVGTFLVHGCEMTSNASSQPMGHMSAGTCDGERLFFQRQDTVGGGPVIVHAVPAGHLFYLTDIVVTTGTDDSDGLLGANVFLDEPESQKPDDPFNVRLWLLAPRRNASLHFSTGVEFAAGEELWVATGGATAAEAGQRVDFFLHGCQVPQ